MKILLAILSGLYAIVVGLRNWLFDKGYLYKWQPPVATICVGNLSVGGTGKTPHTMALVQMLRQDYKVAVLSRGYKRKTRGFHLAGADSTVHDIGDEPMLLHTVFPDIPVAVCEKRVHGVKRLLKMFPDLDVVILDDAYQHRYIEAGYSILLTPYDNLYVHDHYLPLGTLRESKHGSLRANMVIVTKCPDNLRPIDMRVVISTLQLPPYQTLLFSKMRYGELYPLFPEKAEASPLSGFVTKETQVCMLAGIALPGYMQRYLEKCFKVVKPLCFPDHHNYHTRDMKRLQQEFDALQTGRRVIITTQKDAARLCAWKHFPEQLKSYIYVLPIDVEIVNGMDEWQKPILKYMKQKI